MQSGWLRASQFTLSAGLLIALAWFTPVFAGAFTRFGFTYLDFYAIAAISLLLLIVSSGAELLRRQRKVGGGGWARMLLRTFEIYLIAVAIVCIIRYIARR